MSTVRSQHWRDEHLSQRERRRTIGHFLHYWSRARQLWVPTDPAVEEQGSAPAEWSGTWDFRIASLRGALQCFLGDTTDASNRCLVGVRRADRPGVWLNIKALGVNAVNETIDVAARSVTWVDAWTNADLTFVAHRHKLEKRILLKTPGHPASFRFALRLAAGLTYAVASNVLRIYDSQGVEVLRTRPPWGEDANGNLVRVGLVEAASITVGGRTYPTVRVVPLAADLETATYPVTVDPTTTISGTTDIQDALMNASGATLNYGGQSSQYGVQVGVQNLTGSNRRTLLRLAASAIPAGTLTALRSCLTRYSYSGCTVAGQINWYICTDASAWVEGSSTAALENGACCWGHAVYNTLAWNTAGCGGSGTDYDADADPPTTAFAAYTTGDPVLFTTTLDVAWAQAWKAASRVNNGMVIMEPSASNGKAFLAASSEYSANQPYFEVDYTTGPSAGVLYHHARRGRGDG